jgi:hypothetical protein
MKNIIAALIVGASVLVGAVIVSSGGNGSVTITGPVQVAPACTSDGTWSYCNDGTVIAPITQP